jgi:hypothetical protein
MIRIAILIAALAISACAAVPVTSNDKSAWAAVTAAETFVARNGYTSAGHPQDQPVVGTEIFDMLSGTKELIASRKNTLEQQSFGLRPVPGDNSYYVLFRMIHDPTQCRIVLVQNGEAIQMLHDPIPIKSQRWQPVHRAAPPNNSFKPTAGVDAIS